MARKRGKKRGIQEAAAEAAPEAEVAEATAQASDEGSDAGSGSGSGQDSDAESHSGAGSDNGAIGDDGSGDDGEESIVGDGEGGNGDEAAGEGAGEGEGGAAGGKKIVDASGKVLTKEALEAFRKKESRKGVVYLGRVPPFMKPEKVRHLLSQFGDVERIYLVPEDASVARRRKKRGGSRKTNYTEGWVEFTRKKVAKRVAAQLNNTKIGGKRRSFHYHDLWNIKYLRGFKWTQLTQKLAYERKVREQRLRAELAQAKREAAFYIDRAEEAKTYRKMEAKKISQASSRSAGDKAVVPASVQAERAKVRRTFKQVAPVSGRTSSKLLAAPLLQKMVAGGSSRPRKKQRTQ